ncbi:MAG: NAD(P)-dependent oxidoreductase [Rhodospirillaceae bacterium]
MIDALITGAGGFLGRAITARLQREHMTVLPLTSSNGDIADAVTWKHLPPARAVVHLAGRSYVPDSWTDGPAFVRANVLGTEQALAYCRRHGASMVLAGAYVYGVPRRLPISESHPAAPNNPYALSKLMAEELCGFASRAQGIAATALRMFNVYGPGQRPEFLIPSIVRQVLEGREVRVLSLTPRRDYVFLDDVVDAFVRTLKPSVGFRCFNIGSGASHSVSEAIAVVQRAAGTSLPVYCDSVERPQEIPDTVADIGLAEALLGWRPLWSFEDGIRRIVEGKGL